MERIVALDATGTTPFLLTGQQHTPASEVMVIDPTLSYRWALDYQYIRKDQGTLKVAVECFSDVEGTQRIEDNRGFRPRVYRALPAFRETSFYMAVSPQEAKEFDGWLDGSHLPSFQKRTLKGLSSYTSLRLWIRKGY